MAIALSAISFIVPISVIKKRYRGGWWRCQDDYSKALEYGAAWHDDHLFRLGAMNPMDIHFLLGDWKNKHGIDAIGERNGEKYWKECCVIPLFGDGPTLPCDWIEMAPKGGYCWLKGTEPGEIMGNP